MLTSSSNNGNQYLRPEYLTPLPTTLDAKKSPLALLAQTCSQIGADPPSGGSSSSVAKSLLNCTTSSGSSSGSSANSHSHADSHSHSQHALSKSKGNKSHQQHDFHEKHRKPPSGSGSSITQDKSSRSKGNGDGGNGMNDSNGGSNISTSIFPSVTITSSNGGSVGNISDPAGGARHGSYKTASSKVIVSNPGNSSPSNNSSSSSPSSSRCSATPNPTNKSPSASISPVTSSLVCGATNGGAADSTLSSSSKTAAAAKDSHTHSHSSSACNNNPALSFSTTPTVSTSSSLNNSSLTFNKLNLGSAAAAGLLFPNSSASIELALRHGLLPGLYPPHSSAAGQSGIPPYLHSYARLKAAAAGLTNGTGTNAAESLLSSLGNSAHSSNGCRDPFCGGCELGQHLKSCPAGCGQCDTHQHNKNPFLSPFGFPLLPGFPLPPSLAGLYSSHGHSHSSSNSSSLQSYICNWVVGGDSYCGKRFSTSEDLLQHLRTHTNLGSLSSAASTQEAMQSLAAAAAAGYLPFPTPSPAHQSHPLLGSSASSSHLNRTYPTPPLSPLGSNRFHPYAKHGHGSGTASSTSSSSSSTSASSLGSMGLGLGSSLNYASPNFQGLGLGHPALSQYYPYSLYSQRLFGASASSLHP